MKKISKYIAIVMAVLIMISSISVTAFAAEQINESTVIKSGKTYEISSYRDLETLSVLVNENAYNCAGAEFVLTNDIEVNTTTTETKVLLMPFPDFRGTFSGNGHSIKGLYIKGCGFFESLVNATVKDLKIEDAYISMEDDSTYPVGGIAGQITKSTIQNCTFSGTVINAGDYTGGIAGRAFSGSNILNCRNTGVIFGKNYVGGIVGLADIKTTVKSCFNYGATYGTGENKKGILNFERPAYDTITGSCGQSTNYVLYRQTGLLVISGTGKIKDYVTAFSSSPFEGKDNIKYVIIEDGITSVGDFLFTDCKGLEYVSLPDSITRIGMAAFLDCSSLREMKITDKITSIGEPGTVTGGLVRSSVSPFSGCTQMMSFDVEKSNPNYSIGENGELYNKDKTVLIGYPSGNVSKSFVIPETVTSISMCAICENENLEEIHIPKSVQKAGYMSVLNCPNLKDVYYDSSEENWNNLLYSYNSSLASFDIPKTATVHCKACDHANKEIFTVVEPTCRYEGYTVYQCVDCGYKIHSDIKKSLPHNYVYDECITVSTAHEDGEVLERCENCNAIRRVKTEKISTGYNMDNEYISGFNAGTSIDSLNNSLTTAGFASFEINSTDDTVIGTSSNVTLVYDDGNAENYEVIIFGDVNGDGWYDGTDAITVSCLANGMLTREQVGDAAYKAADCNHDGVIDQADVDLLNQAGVLLSSVDQTKSTDELIETSSEYVEYLNLIDQQTDADSDEAPEDNTEATEDNEEPTELSLWNIIVKYFIALIKKIASVIMAF